jgi:hypothetical protein
MTHTSYIPLKLSRDTMTELGTRHAKNRGSIQCRGNMFILSVSVPVVKLTTCRQLVPRFPTPDAAVLSWNCLTLEDGTDILYRNVGNAA